MDLLDLSPVSILHTVCGWVRFMEISVTDYLGLALRFTVKSFDLAYITC